MTDFDDGVEPDRLQAARADGDESAQVAIDAVIDGRAAEEEEFQDLVERTGFDVQPGVAITVDAAPVAKFKLRADGENTSLVQLAGVPLSDQAITLLELDVRRRLRGEGPPTA
jgi:hypothetical protein